MPTLTRKRAERLLLGGVAQCAGNRRNEFTRKVRKVKGVGWEAGALSTGLFAGARLRDVLASAGVLPTARHVAFEGDDNCIEEMFGLAFYFKYQTSIPINKAMSVQWARSRGAVRRHLTGPLGVGNGLDACRDPLGDVILAYEVRSEGASTKMHRHGAHPLEYC